MRKIMSRERILEVVLTMLGAVLLLIASGGKYPYGFYMVLRLVITVARFIGRGECTRPACGR